MKGLIGARRRHWRRERNRAAIVGGFGGVGAGGGHRPHAGGTPPAQKHPTRRVHEADVATRG
jgi:hypothetical protein